MKKIKIILLVPSLMGGGAEKVIVNIAREINRNLFDVSLVCFNLKGEYLNKVPLDINVIDLQSPRVSRGWRKLIRLISSTKPDVILSTSFESNMILLMSKLFINKKIKIIVRESSIPTLNISRKYSIFYKLLYNHADRIICQSNAMMNDLGGNFRVKFDKMEVIRNPVDFDLIEQLAKEDTINLELFSDKYKKIVTVGRLSDEKNHVELINSFYTKYKNNNDYHLYIIGQGNKEEELKKEVIRMNLTNRVHFLGFQKNPYKFVKKADLFVLSSKYEGLPNALLEAICCKVPIIALQHPGGTKEILQMVGADKRFVKELNWEEWWYDKPDEEVYSSLNKHFNKDIIIKMYEETIKKTLI